MLLKRIWLILGLLGACVCFLPGICDAMVRIEILERDDAVIVGGQDIYLRDIARVHGDDPSLVTAIQNIQVDTILSPIRARRISRIDVLNRLHAHHVRDHQFQLSGALSVDVLPQSITVQGEDIWNQVCQHIHAKFRLPQENVSIERLGGDIADVVVFPGTLDCHVHPVSYQDYGGRTYFDVSILVDGSVAQKVRVGANITLYGHIVVAQSFIKRGELFTANNIAVERRDVTSKIRTVLVNPEELYGYVAKKAIRPQMIVESDMIDLPISVKKGHIVNLVAKSGRIYMNTRGVALQNGRLGDMVLVKNLDSRLDVYAQVVDNGIVQVQF